MRSLRSRDFKPPGIASRVRTQTAVAPDRLDHVNPTLIPLLRGALTPDLPLNDAIDLAYDREERAPTSRFAVIIVLSAALWAAIGYGGWAILR